MYITGKEAEKAVLVGVALQSKGVSNEQMREYLDELSFLAETAGAETVKIFTQNLEKPVHATFIGKGKLEEIHAYEKELRAYFLEKMQKLDNIEIYNPDNVYGPIDFNAKGVFAQDAAGYLASRNIAVRSGNHCAKLLHDIIGTDSTVRASLYFYNTKEEVDRFVEAAKDITLENAVGIFF